VINEALDVTGERGDSSLQAQSLRRAMKQSPPKTLTAWEWEEWYARHGVPETHRRGETGGWWAQLRSGLAGLLGRRSGRRVTKTARDDA
jgi:hypothetical protein